MPLNLRATVDIRAPAQRVFDLVCAPERLPEWNASVSSARRSVVGQPVCLGSRAILSGKVLGQTLESETEVVGFEPPRLFATRAIRGPRINTRFVLESLPQGTRLAIDVSGDVPGGALGARMAEGFLRKELTASLERLRLIGEQSAEKLG